LKRGLGSDICSGELSHRTFPCKTINLKTLNTADYAGDSRFNGELLVFLIATYTQDMVF